MCVTAFHRTHKLGNKIEKPINIIEDLSFIIEEEEELLTAEEWNLEADDEPEEAVQRENEE
jgi:hypothetical protein